MNHIRKPLRRRGGNQWRKDKGERRAETYPEHEKLAEVRARSQAIGEFVEWLRTQGVNLMVYHEHGPKCYDEDGDRACGYREDDLQPWGRSIEAMLALYFGVDLERLEQEKRAMLSTMRLVDEVERGSGT